MNPPMTDSKIDPTQRILMWLCAEARIQAEGSREAIAEITARDGINLDSKSSLSKWERGQRWLNGARPIIAAYAGMAGKTPADLWDEAVRLTPLPGSGDGLLDQAASLDDVAQRLQELRELVKQTRARRK